MKKIFLLLFVFISPLIFAQKVQSKSLVELKCRVSGFQSTVSGFQSPVSEINSFAISSQYPVSSIQFVLPDDVSKPSKKNPGLAILFSMILPGMGELYAGDYETGKYFTIADGVLWGVFAGFTSYGNWKENNYKAFAQTNAGVDPNGKDAKYFANIGVYINVDEYNSAQELNRDFTSTYNIASDIWKWQSDNDRKEYRNMWTSSEAAFTNVRFAVGALVLNRLISAINAVRLVSAYNKNLNSENEISYYFSYKQSATLPSSINFNFVKPF